MWNLVFDHVMEIWGYHAQTLVSDYNHYAHRIVRKILHLCNAAQMSGPINLYFLARIVTKLRNRAEIHFEIQSTATQKTECAKMSGIKNNPRRPKTKRIWQLGENFYLE